MGATIIDGKAFAADGPGDGWPREVARLKAAHGIIPGLAVVLVGEDPASQVYVRSKGKQTRRGGHGELRAPAAGRTCRGRAAGAGRRG